MANQSIYDAFEQMWAHTKAKLNGKSDTGHTHATTDITSGVLEMVRGGTGATTAAGILTNLGLTATIAELNYVDGVTSNIQTQLNGKSNSDHTHNYAGSSSAGGAANSANILNMSSKMDYGWNGLNYFNISGTEGNAAKVNDTPTTAWWHILRLNHANATGYYTDLAIPFNHNSIYYKAIRGGSVANSGWVKVLDALNYSSYALPLSGGTVTGTLILSKTTDANQTSDARPALIVGGQPTSTHMEIDCNEVIAKSNGTTETTLYLGAGVAACAPTGLWTNTGTFYGNGKSSSWHNGRDVAKFRVTSQPGYTPALSMKTTTGSWEIGTYGGYNLSSSVGDSVNGTKNWLLFNFVPDYNYTNSVNTVQSRIAFTDYGDLYIQWLNIGNSAATGDLAQITEDAIYTQQDTYEIIPPADNAGVIVGKTIFGPCITKNYNLGNSNYRWKQLYATTTTINTSDRNLKKDFRTFDSDDRYTQFFMDLKPMIFKMKDGESGRDHFGFIAQDVEDSLLNLGYTSLDFAGLCKDAKCIPQQKPTKEEIRNKKFKFQEELPLDLDENGNIQYEYSLRYQEFISLNTYMIQKLYNKIESLENEIKLLKKG